MTHCLRERTQCNDGKNEQKNKQTQDHPEKIKFKLTANKDGHSDGPSEQGDSKKPAASSPEVFQLAMMDFRFSSFLSRILVQSILDLDSDLYTFCIFRDLQPPFFSADLFTYIFSPRKLFLCSFT